MTFCNLLKAVLVSPNLILVCRPKARTIWRKDFVDKNNLIRLSIEAKLTNCHPLASVQASFVFLPHGRTEVVEDSQFRVCNDDPALGRVRGSGLIHGKRQLLNAVSVLLSDDLGRLLGRDILIVLAQVGFCRGCVDGAVGEGFALAQARGHGNAVDRAELFVLPVCVLNDPFL